MLADNYYLFATDDTFNIKDFVSNKIAFDFKDAVKNRKYEMF